DEFNGEPDFHHRRARPAGRRDDQEAIESLSLDWSRLMLPEGDVVRTLPARSNFWRCPLSARGIRGMADVNALKPKLHSRLKTRCPLRLAAPVPTGEPHHNGYPCTLTLGTGARAR